MKFSLLYFLVFVLISSNITLSQNNIGIDTNVKIFRNLVVHQFNNNQSLSGVNLLEGIVVRADSQLKDIHLSDSNSTGSNFFFRSGGLGLDKNGNMYYAGWDTRFGTSIAYIDITQAQFDTVTRIPVSVQLQPRYFLYDVTFNYPGYRYFNAPLHYNTVYSFWLKDKSKISPHNIYGILYLKSARYNNQGDFEITIDVKINTGGENYFGEILPGINNNNTNIAAGYILFQNYPNPFNPSTLIKFSIFRKENVKLSVYDVTGKEIRTLLNEVKSQGYHELTFEAENLSSGVYFYMLTTEKFSDTRRMILLR